MEWPRCKSFSERRRSYHSSGSRCQSPTRWDFRGIRCRSRSPIHPKYAKNQIFDFRRRHKGLGSLNRSMEREVERWRSQDESTEAAFGQGRGVFSRLEISEDRKYFKRQLDSDGSLWGSGHCAGTRTRFGDNCDRSRHNTKRSKSDWSEVVSRNETQHVLPRGVCGNPHLEPYKSVKSERDSRWRRLPLRHSNYRNDNSDGKKGLDYPKKRRREETTSSKYNDGDVPSEGAKRRSDGARSRHFGPASNVRTLSPNYDSIKHLCDELRVQKNMQDIKPIIGGKNASIASRLADDVINMLVDRVVSWIKGSQKSSISHSNRAENTCDVSLNKAEDGFCEVKMTASCQSVEDFCKDDGTNQNETNNQFHSSDDSSKENTPYDDGKASPRKPGSCENERAQVHSLRGCLIEQGVSEETFAYPDGYDKMCLTFLGRIQKVTGQDVISCKVMAERMIDVCGKCFSSYSSFFDWYAAARRKEITRRKQYADDCLVHGSEDYVNHLFSCPPLMDFRRSLHQRLCDRVGHRKHAFSFSELVDLSMYYFNHVASYPWMRESKARLKNVS